MVGRRAGTSFSFSDTGSGRPCTSANEPGNDGAIPQGPGSELTFPLKPEDDILTGNKLRDYFFDVLEI